MYRIETYCEVIIENHYKLKEDDKTLNAYEIDFKKVNGYNELDDFNRVVYEKFIVNILDVCKSEYSEILVPKGIYFVEETQYLVKENPEDDYFIVASGVIMIINRNGSKTELRSWKDEEYMHLKVAESEITKYLRFEYEHHGRIEWLHVMNEGEEWY